jgi:tetratricopeptide (TPR) repeat protein
MTALGALALGGCKKSDGGDENKADNSGAKVTSTMSPTATPAEESADVPITSKSPEAVALFKEARDLRENHRVAEARDKLARAVELDPEFAQAHALLSDSVPPEQGKVHLDRAGQLAAKLGETERLLITAMISEDDEKAAAIRGLADKAAGDWRVQMMVARHHLYKGEIDTAQAAFEKATRLNARAPFPHNNLAYIYADKGQWDKAIASAERYAELVPGEANPLDTKAEILMLAGKFDEAEATFRAALKVAPDFAIAHEGVAATKFHRDDWAGGLAELRAAVSAAKSAAERAKFQNKLAWACVAAGKDKDATAEFATARKLHEEAGFETSAGMAKIQEAEVALHQQDPGRAAKLAAAGLEALRAEEAPEKKTRWAQTVLIMASAKAGDVGAAEKRLTALAEGGDDHYVHYASGHVHLAKGDADTAIKALDNLSNDKWLSARAKLMTAEALDKAGKGAEAKKLRAELASHYGRDIHAIIVRKNAEKAGSS